MNTLPILPESYPAWDWSKSNGIANATQTAQAYYAVMNKRPCAEFSRFVWNDIVNKVHYLVTASGLSWINTYGTVDECKISEQYGALTSNAFNGVRCNLDNIAYTGWKWEYLTSDPGYIGRKDFRGYADVGSLADTLYGWYIIELVRKLNLTIDILKNIAPFSELNIQEKDLTYLQATAEAIPTVRFNYAQSIRTNPQVELRAPRAGILRAPMHINTNDGSILYAAPIGNMQSRNISKTKISAPFPDLVPTAQLEIDGKIKTNVYADFGDIIYAARLIHRESIKSSCYAELLYNNMKFMIVGINDTTSSNALISKISPQELKVSEHINTNSRSTFFLVTPKEISGSNKEKTTDRVILYAQPSSDLSTNSIIISSENVTLEKPYAYLFLSHIEDSTKLSAEFAALVVGALESEQKSSTAHAAEMDKYRPNYISAYIRSKSYQTSAMHKFRPLYIDSENLSFDLFNATSVVIESLNLGMSEEKEHTLGTGNLVYLPALGMGPVADLISHTTLRNELVQFPALVIPRVDMLEFSYQKSETVIIPRKLLCSELKSASKARGTFRIIAPLGVETYEESRSLAAGELIPRLIRYLGATSSSSSFEGANPDLAESLRFDVAEKSKTRCASYIRRFQPKGVQYEKSIKTSIEADLELKKVIPDIWVDPVRTGNNLHIHSAYPQWQTDTNVHLDSGGVWYDPEQSGTNVYIRSKDNMKEVITNE